jgi:hypothetical protein
MDLDKRGIYRGKCAVLQCHCDSYEIPAKDGLHACVYCGCLPSSHDDYDTSTKDATDSDFARSHGPRHMHRRTREDSGCLTDWNHVVIVTVLLFRRSRSCYCIDLQFILFYYCCYVTRVHFCVKFKAY